MLVCLPRGQGCGLARLGSPGRDGDPTQAWGKVMLFGGLRVLTTWKAVLLSAKGCPLPLPWLNSKAQGSPGSCCVCVRWEKQQNGEGPGSPKRTQNLT